MTHLTDKKLQLAVDGFIKERKLSFYIPDVITNIIIEFSKSYLEYIDRKITRLLIEIAKEIYKIEHELAEPSVSLSSFSVHHTNA